MYLDNQEAHKAVTEMEIGEYNMNDVHLESRDINVWFSDNHVLSDVSLSFPMNSVTALIGPSGCGKSSFVRTLNRMHETIPGAGLTGEVLFNGKDIYATGTDPIMYVSTLAWYSRSQIRSQL